MHMHMTMGIPGSTCDNIHVRRLHMNQITLKLSALGAPGECSGLVGVAGASFYMA